MKQMSVVITLGVIHIIILSLFGMYFYRLKHISSSVPLEEKGEMQTQRGEAK